MKRISVLTLLLSFSSLSYAHAATAVVKWQDFKSYQDVRASNQARASFHRQIAKSFEQHFTKLAEQLPKGYTFNVEVTDLDLAGDVRFSGVNELRVVKAIYIPRISLNYTITNQRGEVIKQNNAVSLKDMAFMDKIKRGREETFYYEKRLLTDWFNDKILPEVS